MNCPQCQSSMVKLSSDVLWCERCGVAEVDTPEPYNWNIPEILELEGYSKEVETILDDKRR